MSIQNEENTLQTMKETVQSSMKIKKEREAQIANFLTYIEGVRNRKVDQLYLKRFHKQISLSMKIPSELELSLLTYQLVERCLFREEITFEKEALRNMITPKFSTSIKKLTKKPEEISIQSLLV